MVTDDRVKKTKYTIELEPMPTHQLRVISALTNTPIYTLLARYARAGIEQAALELDLTLTKIGERKVTKNDKATKVK